MIRIALPALLVVLFAAAGCDNAAAAKKKEGSQASQAETFKAMWPRDKVQKLTPEQRQDLLAQALVALKGVNWQHAQDALVSLGRDAGPSLIAMVGSAEPSAASAGPIPSAKVKSVGELAHDTLLLIVQNRSGYRGEMPARTAEAWQAWWTANSSSVVAGD
ncbi:MAG TPA: hypothetical protein PK280_15445 [Planctomycetota bacterium]|nr:hypothetical protein [Planctomycetota bacterium]